MTLRPATPEALASSLRVAHEAATPITRLDLSALTRILEHTPEDMTVTVEAGCTLSALQSALATRGQWLPIDPPHPTELTVAGLLDTNASGPRRCGHGTIREHLIGLRVALADGRLIRSGGKVVKNVAGYDLMKLFIGAHGTLGAVVEATFKLLPLPEAEAFVQFSSSSLQEIEDTLERVLDSELTPTVLDLHRLQTQPDTTAAHALVLGFAGARSAVDWQLELAARLGVSQPADLAYDAALRARGFPDSISVLPSRLIETLRRLEGLPYVARAASGSLYLPPGSQLPAGLESTSARSSALELGHPAATLMQRVKDTFDPRGVFPALHGLHL